jgi:hypothetical protein
MKKLILGLIVMAASSSAMAAKNSTIKCFENGVVKGRTVVLTATVKAGPVWEANPWRLQIFDAAGRVQLVQDGSVIVEDVNFQYVGKTINGRNRTLVTTHIYLDEMDQATLRINANGFRSKLNMSCDWL